MTPSGRSTRKSPGSCAGQQDRERTGPAPAEHTFPELILFPSSSRWGRLCPARGLEPAGLGAALPERYRGSGSAHLFVARLPGGDPARSRRGSGAAQVFLLHGQRPVALAPFLLLVLLLVPRLCGHCGQRGHGGSVPSRLRRGQRAEVGGVTGRIPATLPRTALPACQRPRCPRRGPWSGRTRGRRRGWAPPGPPAGAPPPAAPAPPWPPEGGAGPPRRSRPMSARSPPPRPPTAPPPPRPLTPRSRWRQDGGGHGVAAARRLRPGPAVSGAWHRAGRARRRGQRGDGRQPLWWGGSALGSCLGGAARPQP